MKSVYAFIAALFLIVSPVSFSQTPVSLKITAPSTTVAVGQTLALQAIVTLSNGATQTVTPSTNWSSLNQSVASVNGSGVVSPVSAGTVTVVGTYQSVQGRIQLTTTQPSAPTLASIVLSPSVSTISANSTVSLIAIGTLSNGTTSNISNSAIWVSSNTGVATVTLGVVTGVSNGTSVITASQAGISSNGASVTVLGSSLTVVGVSPITVSTTAGQATVSCPTCGTGSGLDSFTFGNLAPLFSVGLGSDPLHNPAGVFTPTPAGQNMVLAGPATGGNGAWLFRNLVVADIPSLPYDPAGSATTVQSASLQKTNNLSDVANTATARTNLGLGTAATTAATAYDAAGAATAVQTASAQKANNLSDLASVATARTNLGLGTAATTASTAYDAAGAATTAQAASLQKTNNLSDVSNVATARTNLGLGTAATTASTAYDAAGSAAAVAANTINGKPLSSNPSLNSYDVGAVVGPIGGTSVYDQGTIVATFDSFNSVVPVWPAANGANIQVSFLNVSATPETPGPPMILTASVESPIGTRHILTVGGSGTVNVAPGGLVIFDPLSIDVTKGLVFNVYTHGVRTPGNTVALPYNRTYGLISGTALAPNTTSRAGGFYDGIELGTTRTLNDGVANGTTTFTSATASFGLSTSDASDAGNLLTVGGTTYTIVSVTNATTAILSGSPASATGLTFTVAQADKTLTGTIAAGNNIAPGPFAILGQVGTSIRTAGIVGDSISYGVGANLAIGSWAVQALNQAGVAAGLATQVAVSIPFINASQMSETVANLSINHAARFALLGRVRYVLGMLGVNDLTGNATPATLEANFVLLWQQESLRGSRPYYGTIAPHSASSDGWLTLANQSVLVPTNETSRVTVNTWLRDGAPVSYATGVPVPVAVGTSATTANRCVFYIAGVPQVNPTSGVATASGPTTNPVTGLPITHPATGLFELADAVESAHNSGFWAVDAGNRTVTDAVMNSGSTTLTSATANFNSSTDVGHYVSVGGAGVAGATLVRNIIVSVTNSTTAVLTTAASTSVTAAQLTVDGQLSTFMISNGDGLHPGVNGHKLMGAAAGLTVATWQ